MELYRYRKFEYGLREIQEQTIYFAARHETNDPMLEGYIEIYWRGDAIAWSGMLRNYVCSLYRALFSYLIGIDGKRISEEAAMRDVHYLDHVPMGKIFGSLGDRFLQQDNIKELIDTIGDGKTRISKDELLFLLFCIHPSALRHCLDALPPEGIAPEQIKNLGNLLEQCSQAIPCNHYRKFLEESPQNRQKFMHYVVSMISDLIIKFNTVQDDSQKQAWFKIMHDFPTSYVNNLEDFIHPKVYVACFSADGTNEAMWGKYADNQTGICMVYDTHSVNGDDTISIMMPYCTTSQGQESHRYRDEKIYPIKYGGDVQEANFFTMLGRL
ncbi:MAG: hypothetical protein IJT01_00205, partial [Selenomonadaceae bacterium]|nr:hypothetical protein [Selenomonadaceae bacterium]